MNLREKAKSFNVVLELMADKEKGDFSDLCNGNTLTIDDYGFIKDHEKDSEYVVITVKESPDLFYFGGAVLTENMLELDADGFGDEIRKKGLPVSFNKKMSKNKREYATVDFYPTTK